MAADPEAVEQPYLDPRDELSHVPTIRQNECHNWYCAVDDFGVGVHSVNRNVAEEYLEAFHVIRVLGYKETTHDEEGVPETVSCAKCGVVVDRKLVKKHEKFHKEINKLWTEARSGKFDPRYLDGR